MDNNFKCCGNPNCLGDYCNTPSPAVSTSSLSSRYSLRQSSRNVNYTNMDRPKTPTSSAQRQRKSFSRAEDPEKLYKRSLGSHIERIESPKTDYTYSKSQSYHEKTPSPKVENPNLSRNSFTFKQSSASSLQLKFLRFASGTKYLVTSIATFPIHLVITVFLYLSTFVISSIRRFRQIFRRSTQTSQQIEQSSSTLNEQSSEQFVAPNGDSSLRQRRIDRRVSDVNGGGHLLAANANVGSLTVTEESDSQDIVVERRREKIREIIVEKQLVPYPVRGFCGLPCWCCWLPLLLLLLLCGLLYSRERQQPEPVVVPIPSESAMDIKWMKEIAVRLTAAELKLKTSCQPDTKEIQQIRDMIAAYQLKSKDDVAAELKKMKDLLIQMNDNSVSLMKADVNSVKLELQSGVDKQQQFLNGASDDLRTTLKLSLESTTNKLAEYDELRDRLNALEKVTLNCNDCADVFTKTLGTMRSGGASGGLTVDEVNKLISAAIWKYDNDRTGLPDYALEPAGGTVLSTRCSETYNAYTRKESIFGFPLWYLSYSPRTVIQPGVVPGECWAFKGSSGFLVVKLSGLIDVTSFSYEHISKAVSPDGHIDSAPRVLRLFGLMSENDPNGIFMGDYTFDQNGPSLQNFPITESNVPPVPVIEFRIMSNHGHPVYTCLYRLRVHGKRIEPAYGGK